MQDPSLYSQIKAQVEQPIQPQFPEHEQLKCPRCDSTNTKFCYYNNYNLSQPRYFCKNCRRYWTKGGVLRNIPVGGGIRKNGKRRSSSASSSGSSKRPAAAAAASSEPGSRNKDDGEINNGETTKNDENFDGKLGNLMEASGSFRQVLGSGEGQFGNLIDGLGHNGLSLQINEPFCDPGSGQNLDPKMGLNNGIDNNSYEFLNIQAGDEGCWSGNSNGWPDLAINTPGQLFTNK